MNNAKAVQVLDSLTQLEREILDPGLGQLEAPLLYVIEQVFASHVLEDDVVMVDVLKQIH